MAINTKFPTQIVYFDAEGRQNLDEVLRVVKRALKKRAELRVCKIVIFTAEGLGPALAYSRLGEFNPKMIAVTFPRTFALKRGHSETYFPRIPDKVLKFLSGVGIDVVVPPTLPFDLIDGMDGHNQQVRLIGQTIAMFGSGFSLCLQAVMRCCDLGMIEEGESVIAISGDTAGLFSASTSSHFLNATGGISIQEIFCKPRVLTLSRPKPREQAFIEGEITRR